MRLPPKQHQQDDALLHHLTGRDPCIVLQTLQLTVAI